MTTATPTELLGCEDFSPAQVKLAMAMARGSSRGLSLDPKKSRLRKMRSTVTTAARMFQERLNVGKGRNATHRAAMLTLTYHNIDDWSPDHVRSLLTHIRNFLSRRGHSFYYVWTAELQARGAVHYHIVVFLPRHGSRFLKLPKPDSMGWWSHGQSNICWARHAIAYIAKYASKASELPEGKSFPKGLRLYGVGGVLPSERIELRYWRAPMFARTELGRTADIRKVPGGYIDNFTLRFAESPWMMVGFINSRPFFVLKMGVSRGT